MTKRCSLCRMEEPNHMLLCWHGSIVKALGTLQPPQYCNNAWCSARTTHYFLNENLDPVFLCNVCADAFKLGQANPGVGVHTIGGQDEL